MVERAYRTGFYAGLVNYSEALKGAIDEIEKELANEPFTD